VRHPDPHGSSTRMGLRPVPTMARLLSRGQRVPAGTDVPRRCRQPEATEIVGADLQLQTVVRARGRHDTGVVDQDVERQLSPAPGESRTGAMSDTIQHLGCFPAGRDLLDVGDGYEARSGLRAAITTRAPASARARAVSTPMPMPQVAPAPSPSIRTDPGRAATSARERRDSARARHHRAHGALHVIRSALTDEDLRSRCRRRSVGRREAA